MIINLLTNLIEKKFYKAEEDIKTKLNVFYAMSELTDEEYSTLMLKVQEYYTVVEENTEATENVENVAE